MSYDWGEIEEYKLAECMCCEEGKSLHATRIKMWHPFREVLDFFRATFDRQDVVIAGGAIRDMYIMGHDIVSDYDVWVLNVTEKDVPLLDEKAAEASKRLTDLYPGEAEIEKYGGSSGNHFHVPKTVWHFPFIPGDKPVQVMYSQRENMRDLIANFDWRVCSFGFDGETVISDGAEDFRQHALSLNLDISLRSPKSTLRRGFRIASKFARTPHFLNLPNEIILALASMLVLNGESRPEEDKIKS